MPQEMQHMWTACVTCCLQCILVYVAPSHKQNICKNNLRFHKGLLTRCTINKIKLQSNISSFKISPEPDCNISEPSSCEIPSRSSRESKWKLMKNLEIKPLFTNTILQKSQKTLEKKHFLCPVTALNAEYQTDKYATKIFNTWLKKLLHATNSCNRKISWPLSYKIF